MIQKDTKEIIIPDISKIAQEKIKEKVAMKVSMTDQERKDQDAIQCLIDELIDVI